MSTQLTVHGMSCGGCEESVEEALAELDGVTGVEADSDADTVTIEGGVDPALAREAIEDAGYEPENGA